MGGEGRRVTDVDLYRKIQPSCYSTFAQIQIFVNLLYYFLWGQLFSLFCLDENTRKLNKTEIYMRSVALLCLLCCTAIFMLFGNLTVIDILSALFFCIFL